VRWLSRRRLQSSPDVAPPLLGLCVGGPEHGNLHAPVGGVDSFMVSEQFVGNVEGPPLKVLYVLDHIIAKGLAFHVWQAVNGDTPAQHLVDSIDTLLDASASERAAVACTSLDQCLIATTTAS
jgi:hypothetical protein